MNKTKAEKKFVCNSLKSETHICLKYISVWQVEEKCDSMLKRSVT